MRMKPSRRSPAAGRVGRGASSEISLLHEDASWLPCFPFSPCSSSPSSRGFLLSPLFATHESLPSPQGGKLKPLKVYRLFSGSSTEVPRWQWTTSEFLQAAKKGPKDEEDEDDAAVSRTSKDTLYRPGQNSWLIVSVVVRSQFKVNWPFLSSSLFLSRFRDWLLQCDI